VGSHGFRRSNFKAGDSRSRGFHRLDFREGDTGSRGFHWSDPRSDFETVKNTPLHMKNTSWKEQIGTVKSIPLWRHRIYDQFSRNV
jgi:hypothetical protein